MNILVTGASRGIGKCIAMGLSQKHNLFLVARNEILLKSVAKSCSAQYCVCDLTSENDLEKLAEFIEVNDIDVLINNAGEYIYGQTDEMSLDVIKNIYATNLAAPTFLSGVAMVNMTEKNWGRIINIGSISGVMGEAYAAIYSASKAGLIGLTKSMALELAQDNITVNVINPGWVETELGMKSIEESEFSVEETIETIPQKRFVKPEEIEKLIEFLISDDAKGITGQSINVCAGLSLGI